MTTGYVLILAMLVLGCAIATAGDRIGTKVGKARLSLFNLRPRKTATLVTVVTGGLISASTLGILLLLDKQLRTGLFELEEIQQDLYSARQDLQQTQAQKQRVESELTQTRDRAAAVQDRLDALNRALERVSDDLDEALQIQVETEAQLQQTQARLESTDEQRRRAEVEIQRIESQLRETSTQKTALEGEIQQLQQERRQLVQRTEQVRRQLAQRDREIGRNQTRLARQERELTRQEAELARQDEELQDRERMLAALGTQQIQLERQVTELEQTLQMLRERRVALGREQVLASARVRVDDPSQSERAVLALLQEANRVALQLTRPGVEEPSDPTVLVTRTEVQQLTDRLSDGREYVVRVRSAGNYLLGEENVQVFFEVMRNEVVFEEDELVAATTVDLTTATSEDIIEKIYWLVEAARFQAQREGILAERINIGDGRPETLARFLEELMARTGEVEVQAIAQELTYTVGPLQLHLVAVRDGEVVLEIGEEPMAEEMEE